MKSVFEKLSFHKCNFKKLREEREKRNLSLNNLSKAVNIPKTTIANWEKGKLKKIPLDGVKKIAKFYNMDYRYFYGLNVYPMIGTITGLLISLSCGISSEFLLAGAEIGLVAGFLGVKGSELILNKLDKKLESLLEETSEKGFEYSTVDLVNKLFEDLNDNEKEKYELFKNTSYSILETEKYFSEKEIEENEFFFKAHFLAHCIKKEEIEINNENV